MSTGISKPIEARGWVQTERAAHEVWAKFTLEKGGATAGALMHNLCALMNSNNNAVVISQSSLGKLMGKSVDTIQRAIRLLESRNFIQVVRIGKGKEAAYVVNDRVAWSSNRDRLRLSAFSATIIADADEQDPHTLEDFPLHKIPLVFPGEQQLPAGNGAPPPSQPAFDGLEVELPGIKRSG